MGGPVVRLIALICAALAIAAMALSPPGPAPATAPATAFSAERAFGDIRQIAQRPRPLGSIEGARVRLYLLERLRGMGLQAEVRPGPVANIVALLPGTEPAEPALVLMSHYDSVATGPGAGDDAAGVAASLEVVRALRAAGPHKRDVMVLITDGEEAGLLGAKAFYGQDPLSGRVGVVLNMEARGNRGRAVMFETHRDAGALVGWLAGDGVLKGSSSLMPDLYRRLPNDTDLSMALQGGRQGLNFAFFGGQAAYHTAADTPENLDLGSVQHMGDQVLAIAVALADAPVLPGPAPDRVYGDILGGPVAAYETALGWAGLILTAGLIAFAYVGAKADGLTDGRETARGAAAFIILILVQIVVLTAAGMTVASQAASFHGLLTAYPWILGGMSLLSAGAALGVIWACSHARGRWPRTGPWGLWLGALTALTVLAALTQALAPLDAFMLGWPALAGAICAAAMQVRPGHRFGQWIALAVAVLALSQIVYWAGLMFALVGPAAPAVLGLFAALAAAVTMPWAAGALADRRALALPVGLEILGVAGLIVAVAAAQ